MSEHSSQCGHASRLPVDATATILQTRHVTCAAVYRECMTSWNSLEIVTGFGGGQTASTCSCTVGTSNKNNWRTAHIDGLREVQKATHKLTASLHVLWEELFAAGKFRTSFGPQARYNYFPTSVCLVQGQQALHGPQRNTTRLLANCCKMGLQIRNCLTYH